MDYETGKIYKLVSKFTDVIYVGSSIDTLVNRLYNHKCKTSCSSRTLFELGEVNIVLLEHYPCESELDLRIREQFYMDKFREEGYTLVNKHRAYTSPEMLKEQHKEYRETNKDKLQEYGKEYKQKHKEKQNEKFTCECGGRYTYQHKSLHSKTQKHIAFIESL